MPSRRAARRRRATDRSRSSAKVSVRSSSSTAMSVVGRERGTLLDELPEAEDVLRSSAARVIGAGSHVVTGTRDPRFAGRPPARRRAGAPRSRRVRPRRQARHLRLARPRRGRVRGDAARSRGRPRRRRLPDAAVVDQVRRVLRRRACGSGRSRPRSTCGSGRASRRASSPAPSRAVTVLGDGAVLPEGVDAGRVVPVDGSARGVRRRPARRRPGSPRSTLRPDLHRVDQRDDRRAQGRGVRPRAPGRRSPATSTSSRRRGERRLVVLPFPHVGYMTRLWDEFAPRHDRRARRGSVVGRRDASASSATRASR